MQQSHSLDKVPLFAGLDSKHLDVLSKMTHPRSFRAGENIVQQGEQGIGLYVIQSGKVEVVQKRDGGEGHLRAMGPGECFGEIGLLTDYPRTATVRATEPTECLVITAWNFRASLQESPDMARQLLGTVAGWLVEAEART